jgi:hypothetical protein
LQRDRLKARFAQIAWLAIMTSSPCLSMTDGAFAQTRRANDPDDTLDVIANGVIGRSQLPAPAAIVSSPPMKRRAAQRRW